MTSHNVRVELATREDLDDFLIVALGAYHPAIARSERGWVEVYITLPAEDLRQAALTGLAVIGAATSHAVVALEVLTTAEFDARNGLAPVPELVSVTEAAEILGVTRQAILQRIDGGSLPATRVGTSWVLQRGALTPGAAAGR